MNVNSIVGKINRVMAKLNITDRLVSKRITTLAAGDPLTGRGGSAAIQDTVLSPQPIVEVAAGNYPLMVAGTEMASEAEYLVLVSIAAMSRDEVVNPALSIIFTDSAGKVEELFVVGFAPTVLLGADISFHLVLSSKKR